MPGHRQRTVWRRVAISQSAETDSSSSHSEQIFKSLNINPKLQRGLFEMGLNRPSQFQKMVLPVLLINPPENVIAQAQSGTGKSIAYILAMLNKIDVSKNYPQVLCILPTYELAIQVGEVATRMSKYSEIKIEQAVKGNKLRQGDKLNQHVIIGTPGKINDWLVTFKAFDIKKIDTFVLDEADIMLASMGPLPFNIYRELDPSCQSMFFSATYSTDVLRYAQLIVKNPITTQLGSENDLPINNSQFYAFYSPSQKYKGVINVCNSIEDGQVMVFCRSKAVAAYLARKLVRKGQNAAALTSDLPIGKRKEVMDKFRQNKIKTLVTTNVLARGIHVPRVTMIVNYDLPTRGMGLPDYRTYLHRMGRVGRLGRVLVFNIVHSDETRLMVLDFQDHFLTKIKCVGADEPIKECVGADEPITECEVMLTPKHFVAY